LTQDPNPHQTDIDSVIHQDDTETPTTNVSLATNGNTSGNGRAVVKVSPAANGKRKSLRPHNAPGLTVERRFTRPGEDVYSTVEWELRDAVISNERGEKVFEQKDVEIPKTWTQLATNVVVSKYFRGHLGTPQRERSVRQLIHRVADTMANWGRAMDYFATEADAQAFQDELTHILLHQKAAFNSPVWFNVGLADQPRPQCSACFINSVDDTMESILTLAKTEGMLFKYGSGTGTNLSPIRGSREPLQGGGTASGPISFMRGFDQFAGAIKCLTPDAYIYTDRGLQTLGEILDTTLPPGFHPDESVLLATKDGPTRISHVYVSPVAETFRLRLRHTGLTLRGTAEHPVLTLTPDFELVWKRLTDLAVGDRVAVSRRMEMWPTAAPSFGDFQPRAPWAKKPLSYPTEMTAELARLLGYMVSEGCLDDERFRFSNADEDVFRDFLACVRAVFGVDPTANVRRRVHPKTGVTTWLFEACWTNAVRFLKHVGLTTARSEAKTVPWSVRCAPRAQVIEFLRAYFEGDGHISTHVYAASASKALLSEVQLLLLNLGMVPALRPHPVNGKTYWNLYLWGEQAWQFVREVGFVSACKRQAAQFAGDKNTNVDSVPFLADVLRTRVQGVRYLRCADGVNRSLAFGFFNRRPGTQLSYNLLRSAPGLIEKVRTVHPDWAATLETILEREFFWDSVAEVEAAEPAVTYDFTVPGTHSFIANGIVNHNSGGKTRRAAKMTILNIDHPDIADFITCKEKEERKAWALIDAGYSGMFNVPGGAYDSVHFQNANHSVRVTDEFMRAYEQDADWQTRYVLSKQPAETYKARELMRMIGQSAWVCGDPGIQYDTTINKWHTCKNTDKIYASNPCSEYMFLNDSACNLASINLMRFRREDGEFDVEAFKHTCRILITAQEIIVDNASYPTPRIAENSHDYRPLGLGYANLGALLMARGVPYDSDAGRAYAGAITAVMTGEAYHQSSIIARDHGWPFPGYDKNREPFLEVMRMHRAAVEDIEAKYVPDDLLNAARQSWDDAIASGEQHGYRNAQATVLAPTGTIGFLMDCDTTGIEPDIAIVKYKNLVGGGVMKIVNNTVPEALQRLGYSPAQIETILAYIDQHDTIEGAPGLKEEHLPIFDCAFKPGNGTRSIHYMGHVRMMAAAQPFISGAISKTVNMPNEATPEEIVGTYVEGWKLGLKAIAIYRDGSKRTQPLMTKKAEAEETQAVAAVPAPTPKVVEVARPMRRKLPDERRSITHKFSIAGHEGYITVGMYEDGTPGEIFLTMSKEGSTISGLMDSFATAISLALQYGVPLQTLVDKFGHTRFEPSGITNNPEIRFAKSIMDYIFRWLGTKFLNRQPEATEPTLSNGHGEENGALLEPATTPEAYPPLTLTAAAASGAQALSLTEKEKETFQNQADAPICTECGSLMVRNGACFKCLNCGSVFGCS
jgi:ribonucleoside-diphosphate reductase alpha chain